MKNFKPKTPTKRRKRGQAMSEYLILVSLVAVGSIGVVQVLSRNLKGKLAEVSNDLGGIKNAKVKGVRADEEKYKVRDMGDFSDAIQNNKD